MSEEKKLTPQPIPWWQSTLWFALPGLFMLIGVNVINPYLVDAGVPLIWSFTPLFYGPLLLVGLFALVAYQADGYQWKWSVFSERMRLTQMRRRDWTWAGAGLLATLVAEALFAEALAHWLMQFPGFAPPSALPALFDPTQPLVLPPETFFGEPLTWWVAVVYAVALFVNITGEEIAWRGYLLPRQEQTHGQWAWLINGLMWLFLLHAVLRWMYLGLLPTGLITPFVAQRTQNTWTAVIIHGTGNLVFLILIVIGLISQ